MTVSRFLPKRSHASRWVANRIPISEADARTAFYFAGKSTYEVIVVNLSNGIKITKVAAASSAGTSAVESSAVDMAGFEGVLFFTTIGTSNAGNFLKAQIGEKADGSDAADLEGTKVTAEAGGQVVWVDVYRPDPNQKYVRAHVTRGSSTTVGDIYALQYESRKQVVDNNIENTIIGKLVVSPYEGTA